MSVCELSVQEALWRMDDSRLSVEQLTALSRAVPEEQERRDIGLFLKVCYTSLYRQNALGLPSTRIHVLL